LGLELRIQIGQTRLDDDEKEALLIPTVTTQIDLDQFEQLNVEDAVQWTLENRFSAGEILSESFVKNLHHRMFGNTWSWAGQFRTTNKNLGVDKFEIRVFLRLLLGDTRLWIGESTYDPDEICVRFKHRFVTIHCFPNGNGRHARLMADVLVQNAFDRPVFTWGGDTLRHPGQARSTYISALRAADDGEIGPLLAFARS